MADAERKLSNGTGRIDFSTDPSRYRHWKLSTEGDVGGALTPMIAQTWSLATALSLLAWYVFAPQCLSTLVIVKRETNSWRYPLIMAGYLFALAYLASFVTFQVATALLG